ncbi:MAG TPA: hypothetical protein VFR23_11555 [Jiangellaceae bacterium]|nr:hypothetical protein [Jiangellaceae bacterium]
MATVAAPATERNWCAYCPDLILVGEMVITDPDLFDPLGDPGVAHRDCAEAKGWTVDQQDDGGAVDARALLRQHIRENGPIGQPG